MTDTVDAAGQGAGTLASWGYDDHFRACFDAIAHPSDLPGRVLRADRSRCLVALDGKEVHLDITRVLLADPAGQPTAGDFVVVREGRIALVLERRTALTRAAPDPGRGAQVLAANIEFVLVAEPLGERWRPRRLERLLVAALGSGAIPIVVLTKADRVTDLAEAIAAARACAPGVSVHAVSAPTGEGVDELAAELTPGTSSVIIGRSGAGKSTLANALSAGWSTLSTAPVRGDGKGRHTTVARELVALANGALLIDTPGVRALGLADSADAISEAFTDLEELAASCRFNDCAHETEPGCAVTRAIASGDLDAGRLESYRRLQREQDRLEARDDPRLRALRSARWRQISKEARQLPRR